MTKTFLHGRKSHHVIALILFLMLSASAAPAQTTSFTYQGRLSDGGMPANGNYDLQFALWDSLSSGTQIGSTQTLSSVAVSGGIFTVQLEFGACATCFNGAARFLEIAVKPTSSSTFTTLGPRQQITSTPYSVRSANATTADSATTATNATIATNATQLGGVAASQYVITTDSRLSDSRPPTPGSSNYIQNTTSTQSSSNFNIDGNGTAGGTLSANIVNATTQYNMGGSRVLSATGFNTFVGAGAGTASGGFSNTFVGQVAGTNNSSGINNSFLGTLAGNVNTSGSYNSFFGALAGHNNNASENAFFGQSAGTANGSGAANSFFGRFAGSNNTMGSNNSFFGYNAGLSNTTEGNNTFIGSASNGVAGITNATAIGANASVTQSNSLVLGSINGVNGANADTSVGVGTTNPNGLQIGSPVSETARAVNNVRFGISSGTPRAIFEAAGSQWEIDNNGGRFRIFNPGAERFTIDSSGNVGINTAGINSASLDSRLNVYGTNVGNYCNIATIGIGAPIGHGCNSALAVTTDNPSGSNLILGANNQLETVFAVTGSGNVFIAGNVAIGAFQPDQTLSVGVGNASKPGGGSWLAFSDERLKNIKGRFTPGLKAVMQLQPLRYEYKRNNGLGIRSEGEHIGFGAEAVQRIIPEAVTKDDKGYLLVNDDPIMWAMLNAIKEQQAEIQQAQTQIRQQQTDMQSLKAANARLSAHLRLVEKRAPKRSATATQRHRRGTNQTGQ